MSKLAAALAWAARGFPVFPLQPNTKDPAFEGSWIGHATTDAEVVRAMWTDPVLRTERDYNIGVNCTDYVVVDIDVKKGKDGYNEYMQLGGTFDTLVVKTPSGGYHCYFEGPDSSNAPISDGIDIRSHHGYVVAPGSIIDGVPYEIVNDVAPAWVPLVIETRIKPPDIRSEFSASFEVDTPASIQAGINYLQTTPVAIEGRRGDETTFITAARLVREIGLSPFAAYELMRDHWNERCLPPWSLDELQGKVENAAAYGTAELGRLDPSVLFATVAVEPPPSPFEAPAVMWGNGLLPAAVRPRPWLYDGVLMTGKVSLIGAVGSAGKSSVGLALAAHAVQGLDFGPHKAHRACKVIVYNGEDDVEEQSRRLMAVCMAYSFDYEYVRSRVMLLSHEEVNMRIVTSAGRMAVPNEVVVNGLKLIAQEEDVGLIVLDPLIGIHYCDENDPMAMNIVMETLQHIAGVTGTAILVMHHTTKTGNDRQEDRVGNMNIFRGTSGIVYSCRAAFTLMDASSEDAADYGLQDHERHMWVRMDDAKVNLTLKRDKAMWFKKSGVKIVSGDIVGVLKHEELVKNVMHLRMRVADVLAQTMITNGTASMMLTQAVAVVKLGEPLMSNQKDTEVRQKLESYFVSPVQIREKTLQINRETSAGKPDKITVVLS